MKKSKAFTLIELLVVIAIIGVLATISVIALSNARAKARDSKRAGNVKQIQTALEMFYNDKGRYPTEEEWLTGKIFSTTTNSTTTYMQIIPTAPTPIDGSCTDSQNTFSYTQTQGGNSYTISFCLGGRTGTLTSGPKCLTPGGIIDVDCSATPIPEPTYLARTSAYIGSYMWQYFLSAKIDGTSSYAVGYSNPEDVGAFPFLVKYNNSDLSVAGQKKCVPVSIGNNFNDLDYDNQNIYVVGSSEDYDSNLIAKFSKNDLSLTDARNYSDNSYNSAYQNVAVDDSYIYAAGSLNSASGYRPIVVKYDKSDLSVLASYKYSYNPTGNYSTRGMADDADYLYVITNGNNNQTAVITKIDKSDLSVSTSRSFYSPSGTTSFNAVHESGDHLFVVGTTNYGTTFSAVLLVKYNKSDLSVVEAKIFDYTGFENGLHVTSDSQYLYIVASQYVVKCSKDDLSLISARRYLAASATHRRVLLSGSYLYLFGEANISALINPDQAIASKIKSELPSGTYSSDPSGFNYSNGTLNESSGMMSEASVAMVASSIGLNENVDNISCADNDFSTNEYQID